LGKLDTTFIFYPKSIHHNTLNEESKMKFFMKQISGEEVERSVVRILRRRDRGKEALLVAGELEEARPTEHTPRRGAGGAGA
jgi:hypothetical protein